MKQHILTFIFIIGLCSISSLQAYANDDLKTQILQKIEMTIQGTLGEGYDEAFYKNLETYLLKNQGQSEQTMNLAFLQEALDLYKAIFSHQSFSPYYFILNPNLKESIYRVTEIYIKHLGKDFIDYLIKHPKTSYYLDFNNEKIKNTFFFAKDPAFSELRMKYFSELMKNFENQSTNKVQLGRFEAYGYVEFPPSLETRRIESTVGKAEGAFYYNPKVDVKDAPENVFVNFFNEVFLVASKNGNALPVFDLAQVILSEKPRYSNAFLDLFDDYFKESPEIYNEIINRVKLNENSLQYIDPRKEAFLSRVDSDFKIKWGFAFLQGDILNKWNSTQESNTLYYKVLKSLEDLTKTNSAVFLENVENILINEIYIHNILQNKNMKTLNYLDHISILLLKILDRASQNNDIENRAFLKDFILNGHKKINAIDGRYPISENYIADLLVSPPGSVESFSESNTKLKILEKLNNAYRNPKPTDPLLITLNLSFYRNNLSMFSKKQFETHLSWILRNLEYQTKLELFEKLDIMVESNKSNLSTEAGRNLSLLKGALRQLREVRPSVGSTSMSCKKLMSSIH